MECKHEHTETMNMYPETGEVFYKCLDCGALINQDGEVVIEPSDIIPF